MSGFFSHRLVTAVLLVALLANESVVIAARPMVVRVQEAPSQATSQMAALDSAQMRSWGGPPSESEKEYWEAKGALLWLPMIKRVVDEGIAAGAVQSSERTLFESLLLGVVGVEAGGGNPFIKRPHDHPGAVSSDGLTQLIRLHLWSNENPFDPLTNLRAGLRTLARYYRGYGNRWDLALVEHLSASVSDPAQVAESGSLAPGTYARRVVDVNQMARRLLAAGDQWDDPYYFKRDPDALSRQGMALAPPWDIYDPPDLPFNWAPPPTSRAYELWAGVVTDVGYLQRAGANGVQVRLAHRDDPGDAAPYPNDGDAAVMFDPIRGPIFTPRPATAVELALVQGETPVPAEVRVDYPVGR